MTGAHDFAAWLISKRADVNLCFNVPIAGKMDGGRAIDWAVLRGHTKAACLLLEHGAEVSMSNKTWQQQQQQQQEEGYQQG
jgi:ankyrin repeat protein